MPVAYAGRAACAFAAAGAAYWTRVFPLVSAEIAGWRRRALAIPDPALRDAALAGLRKRSNVEGAVVFATFAPAEARARVVRASAALQAAYDYLDVLTERPHREAVRYSSGMHEALLEALRLDAAALRLDGAETLRFDGAGALRLDGAETLRFDGARAASPDAAGRRPGIEDDGGYLGALVGACREALAGLPSYPVVEAAALRAAQRVVRFQAYNCGRQQGDELALARWAGTLAVRAPELAWWELAASAGSSLGALAMIGAAAEPALDHRQLRRIEDAYHPAIGCLHSLLDQLVDLDEDDADGQLNLVRHYGGPTATASALRRLTASAAESASKLDGGRAAGGHSLVLAGMAASYLHAPQARDPRVSAARRAVLAELGPLAGMSIAIFRTKRLAARR